jgi:glycolate oxidase FAD binding subunit
VLVLIEGVEAGVGARAEATRQLLGTASEISDVPEWFGRFPFGEAEVGLKITTTLSGVGPTLSVADDISRRHGVPISVRGSAAGVLYAAMPANVDPTGVAHVVDELRSHAATFGGTVVVLTAPARHREALDVWGPVAGLELMRRLKDQLDPDHRLSPGRFVVGSGRDS